MQNNVSTKLNLKFEFVHTGKNRTTTWCLNSFPTCLKCAPDASAQSTSAVACPEVIGVTDWSCYKVGNPQTIAKLVYSPRLILWFLVDISNIKPLHLIWVWMIVPLAERTWTTWRCAHWCLAYILQLYPSDDFQPSKQPIQQSVSMFVDSGYLWTLPESVKGDNWGGINTSICIYNDIYIYIMLR